MESLYKPTQIFSIAICLLSVFACHKADTQEPVIPVPDTSPTLASVPLVPAKGALLGHYYGTGSIAETDEKIGRKPPIHLTYYGWTDHWATSEATKLDISTDRIPLINWEPFDVNFTDIILGKYDDQIKQQANEAKTIGKKFFLDFAAEMNEEEGWGNHDPDLYIQAFRHIHAIFEQQKVTNAVWVWCPNNVDLQGGAAAMRYYPGDKYVDWVGADGYNWGTSDEDHAWETFDEVFSDIYSKIAVTGKPIIIGEMGSDEVGGDKAKWLSEVIPTLKNRFPAIKAVVWFDIDKERHWQINSSQRSLAAYRTMAKDIYFN